MHSVKKVCFTMPSFHVCPAKSISILFPDVFCEGAVALARVLQDQSNLAVLSISRNRIGDEGACRGLWSRQGGGILCNKILEIIYLRSD
jgi:hypothetical protein